MRKAIGTALPFVIAAVLSSSPLAAREYRTMLPVTVDDTLRELPLTTGSSQPHESAFLLPPGTLLDSSYYDWQANASMGKRIRVNSDGSIHVAHMKSPDAAFADRGMHYYYADNTGLPFFSAGNITGFRNGFGSLSSYLITYSSGAIAVISTHNFGSVESFIYVDAYQGLGAFSEMITNNADQLVWPKPSVNSDGSIMVLATLMNNMEMNGITHNVAWDRASDIASGFSQTWTWLGVDAADWSQAAMEFPSMASGTEGRVGIVISDFAADLHLFESTDNGVTFAESLITNASQDTIALPSEPDSSATVFLPWINSDIVYLGTEPHIV